MDIEIKTKWLIALRSGKYPQTRKTLRTTEGYCCLGVLCEVVEGPSWELIRPANTLYNFVSKEASIRDLDRTLSTMPPYHILDKAGLSIPYTQMLADANDSGRTFLEIADMIEQGIGETAR